MAISGNNVLIGVAGDDTNGFNAGRAFLFNATNGNLLQTFNDPSPVGGDRFGNAVAISGNNVLIGDRFIGDPTPGEIRAGQVFLFDTTTGNLLHTFNDFSPSEFESFGGAVAVSGNNVLIGDRNDDTNGPNVGQALLFDAITGNLLQTFNDPNPGIVDAIGGAVAISGNNVLIGAVGDDTNGINTGQAYLFDVATGNLLHTFNDPNPERGDAFGLAVGISGNNILIGTGRALDDTNGRNDDQAFLFDAITGDLLQTFNTPLGGATTFGWPVAISGNNVLISESAAVRREGRVFLFVPEPATWMLLALGIFALRFGRKAHG